MSNMDTLLQKINPNKKSISRAELIEFVREAITQIGEINEAYKKYFESTDSNEVPAVFNEIEAKIEKISEAYTYLYSKDGTSDKSKVAELKEKIDEIKAYHANLLSDDDSVESEIEEAREKITEFYEYLFGDDKEDGIEPEVRKAIKDILQSQKDIATFEDHVKNELKPFLTDTKSDIETKRKEVDALLSDAIVGTLAQGYSESKSEYSIPIKLKFKEWKKAWVWNIYAVTFNTIGRKIGFLTSYTFFIMPLVGMLYILINETTAKIVLQSLSGDGVRPSATELIYIKTIISIPLIWIAWYAQRNISQRKRLFEEYNHKLRVVQMYLMFATKKESYPLDARDELETTLIEVIKRNPSEVFGRDETILDKFAGIFGIGKSMVQEALSEVSSVTEKIVKATK